MKRTNPSDRDLDVSFATIVAGYTMHLHLGAEWRVKEIPHFTTSFDAVLPWLEKHTWRGCSYRSPEGDHFSATVNVVGKGLKLIEVQSGKSLAHAAVIALLRAHGVQVEFTK